MSPGYRDKETLLVNSRGNQNTDAHVANGSDMSTVGSLHICLSILYNNYFSGHRGQRQKSHQMKERIWV